MRIQSNKQQMKEQGKNAPDQTNEEEIGSLPEKEFRVVIGKKIQNTGNRMEKIQGPRRTKEQTNNDKQHNK